MLRGCLPASALRFVLSGRPRGRGLSTRGPLGVEVPPARGTRKRRGKTKTKKKAGRGSFRRGRVYQRDVKTGPAESRFRSGRKSVRARHAGRVQTSGPRLPRFRRRSSLVASLLSCGDGGCWVLPRPRRPLDGHADADAPSGPSQAPPVSPGPSGGASSAERGGLEGPDPEAQEAQLGQPEVRPGAAQHGQRAGVLHPR